MTSGRVATIVVGAGIVIGAVALASFIAGYRASSSVWEETTGLRLVRHSVPATNWVEVVRTNGGAR